MVTNRRAAPPCYRASRSVSLSPLRTSIAAVFFFASVAPCCADSAPVIHYAPAEPLEHIDVALIDRAEHEIDTDVLTDWPVMQALTRAAVARLARPVIFRCGQSALPLGRTECLDLVNLL